jgi:hypothetical protein
MAQQAHSPRMSLEAQTRLPTPNEALDKAYAVHAASDPDLEGTMTQELSRQIAQEFLDLKPRHNNLAERAYINDALKPAVHSYARGLYQSKKKWKERVLEAVEIRQEQEARLNSGFLSSQGAGILLVAIRPFLLPLFFAFVTAILTLVIGQIVPDKVADATNPNWVIGGASAFAAFLGRIISVKLRMSAQHRIREEFDRRLDIAEHAYHESKKKEYRRGYQTLCTAWKQYTGKSYRKTITFQDVMDGDLIFKQKLNEILNELNKPWHARAKDMARDLRESINEFRQKKPTNAAPLEKT